MASRDGTKVAGKMGEMTENLTSPCGFFNTSKLAITLFAI
jgi:hypothetical protein